MRDNELLCGLPEEGQPQEQKTKGPFSNIFHTPA
jgi:hypothetical protein